MPERSDEQLLSDYRARGDRGAFRSLIERHHDDLLRFLRRLTGDHQLAEDIFQDAFLQVHLSAHTFDTSRAFRPWLFTIAANKARDQLRKRTRRAELELSAPAGGDSDRPATFVDLMEIDVPGPDAAALEAERDAAVQRAIERLSLPLREILLLAYFQRLSYAQIADELGIPLGTVKSRLHAAVAAFARAWRATQDTDSRQSTEDRS